MGVAGSSKKEKELMDTGSSVEIVGGELGEVEEGIRGMNKW